MKNYTLFLLLIILAGCSKDNIEEYVNEPAINIQMAGSFSSFTDSVFYSFVVKNSSIMEETIYITATVMGDSANHDRQVVLEADPRETTAQQGVHYELGSFMIPAHAFSAQLPVIIKRTPDLKDQAVRLTLRTAASPDFRAGTPEYAKVTIVWNDVLSKPANWDDIWDLIFGDYNKTKHRFINDHTNLADKFEDEDYINSVGLLITSYTAVVKEALGQYNAEHPGNPLRDEDTNTLVTFP